MPDVPPLDDCYDDECPAGSWCGPSHDECRPMDVVEACPGEPAHRVVEVAGVVGSAVDVRVADIDGDLDHDAVVLWDAAVTVVLQDGNATPLPLQALNAAGPRALDIGDLDGDAVVDLAVATSTAVHWAAGLGDGTFGAFSEFVTVEGADISGFGLGRAGIEDTVNDVVVFVEAPATLTMLLNDGTGSVLDVLHTTLDTDVSGAFAATDRGFSDALALVGSSGVVLSYVPEKKTFVLEEAGPDSITNADVPVVDVDIARTGGGVHTFGFVNLHGWTFGGYLAARKGIETTSRLIVGNGGAGFDYAFVTEDDRVLVIDGCYDAHALAGAPVAADAGDLDGDGLADLAVVMNGIALTLLLSGPG
jgi:hypothetical protein